MMMKKESEFDGKAADWDKNPMHWDRSVAITDQIKHLIPLNSQMTALEFGAGTGIASFLLKDHLKEITLMDNSSEMVKVMDQKIRASGVKNLKTLLCDLEQEDFKGETFDLIFTQMVLHHVADPGKIIRKFHDLLNPEGYLAIADLYPEDGAFHGDVFTGHRGFDAGALSNLISSLGFINVSHRKCFTIERMTPEDKSKQFDVFLLTAQRKTAE
jgi:ubiquinone/menaquinone biosynthesis C-methylase UbiE